MLRLSPRLVTPTDQTPSAGFFAPAMAAKPGKKFFTSNDHTGGIDIVFDPHNPHILFAAMWEGYRTPWTLNSGGEKRRPISFE